MSKHTPGPWEVSCSVQVVGASPGNRCIVAQPFTDGTQGPVIAMEAQIANANLIAAAPDLLEALENLTATISEPDDQICCSGHHCGCMGATKHQQAVYYAKEAITRARGQS